MEMNHFVEYLFSIEISILDDNSSPISSYKNICSVISYEI